MSNFTGYKTKAFSESQKFFVLDPNTGSPSFVQGSELVAQITPNSNYVYSESTRTTAQATDYAIGSLVQTAGATSAGDNFAAVYLVVASGAGDFPMDNGNELLVIVGDELLREQLATAETGEGSDLVVKPDTGETVTAELDKRTIYVGSVAELEALSLPVGTAVYLTENGRSGAGEIKSGSHASDPFKGRFIDLANGNYWDRIINDGIVLLSWFGPDTSGATEQESLIQSAVDLTPDFYTLSQDGLVGTLLVDIPAGQAIPRPRAVHIDHPMKLKGSPALVTKVKDFSSAWADYSGTMHVYQAEASDVTISGVFVDANADNHYETDGSGNKFWEAGPTGKRPPNGIGAYCPDGTNNLTNVVLEDNDVYRPLQGITAVGSLGTVALPLDAPSFLNGTLDTNLVDGVIIRNNTTRRCRGNDVNMSSGVINGEAYGNKSYNSMYHPVRLYTSTINCHAYDNHAYVDYDYLATGYNQTDLWYWRTDDALDAQYLIRRSGMRAGAGFTSVIDCSITNNTIQYQSNNPASSIIDVDSVDAASFQTNVNAVKNVQIKDNKSYRSPFGGLFGIALASADDGKETEGVVFSGNEIYQCRRRQVLFQGNNFSAFNNTFEDCSVVTISAIVRLAGNKIRYFKNNHRYNLAGASNSNKVFEILSSTASGDVELFVSDNLIEGFTGTYYTQSDAAILVHGTDVGIKPSLSNGWVNSGGSLTLYKNCAGQVSAVGLINGGASTSDTALIFPLGYGAKENGNGHSVAIQMDDIGDGTPIGEVFPSRVTTASLIINKRGFSASRASFMFTYQSDGRLFS